MHRSPFRRRFGAACAAVAAAGLLFGSGLAAAGALPDCVDGSRWLLIGTRHFDLLTNAAEAEARGTARKLEWFSQAVERWDPALRDRSGRRVLAYALSGADCFRPFRVRFEGRPAEVEGFAAWSALGRTMAFAAGVDTREYIPSLHEMFHTLAGPSSSGLPTCLAEGMAEFFSTFRAGERTAEFGHAIARHRACLRARAPMSLDALFAVTNESRIYREGEGRALFYAESWALVRYLMTRAEDSHERFDRFLESLQQGRPPLLAFGACFPGESWDDLPATLVRLAGGEDVAHVELRVEQAFEPVDMRLVEPSRRDVCSRLGELMARVESAAEREEQPYLDAALAPDSRHARTLATLGWLAERRGHGGAAEAYYRRALGLDSTDARSWFIAGYGELWRWWKERHLVLQGVLPPELAEARRRLGHCLRLEPDDAEALALWGRTFYFDLQPPPEALAALERASEALPNRTDTLGPRLIVLAHAGRVAEARALFAGRLAPLLDREARRRVEAEIDHAARGVPPSAVEEPVPKSAKGPRIVSRAPVARPGEVIVRGKTPARDSTRRAETDSRRP